MLTRRQGLLGASSLALTPGALALASQAARAAAGRSDEEIAQDEGFWLSVAGAYRLDERYIILNGGGNNPHPASVTDALSGFDQLASSARARTITHSGRG